MKIQGSRRSAGLSLIEVIIGMAILSAVMLMTYTILFSVTTTSSKGSLNSNLDDRGKKVLSFCKTQFYDARFRDTANLKLGIFDDGTQIHYQVALRQNTTGTVDFGYVGGKVAINSGVPDYTPWVGYSCVIRFEPELALYEANTASPIINIPGTKNTSGPQEWQPNPYSGTQLKSGDPLPVQVMNMDMNGDGKRTSVFVKGKIWKYVMDATNKPVYLNPTTGSGAGLESLSDDVILCVSSTGTFNAEIDGLAPVGQPLGKDWLFRYLLPEPKTPTTYGNTDIGGMAAQAFPSTTDVSVAVTVWHGVDDGTGKGFFLRKAWDRIPFRLSNN